VLDFEIKGRRKRVDGSNTLAPIDFHAHGKIGREED
jgi:hypothetical protein